jgi:putative transposase
MTSKACNLSNAVRFRQRQVVTARSKNPDELTDNERFVVDEIRKYSGLDVLSEGNGFLSNRVLYHVFQDGRNPDYYADGLSVQSAQQTIKKRIADWESWLSALKSWEADSSRFTGKPEMPGYFRKGGHETVFVTNQDCKLKTDQNGVSWACFPYHKKTPLCVGRPEGRLKEAQIRPTNGRYEIVLVFDVEIPDVVPTDDPKRIVAIDLGVDNLMATTNNFGESCFLYKGGIVKSENRFYNKRLAEIMTAETTKADCPKNRNGSPKFVPTEESMSLTTRRNHLIKNFMRQVAVHFMSWCAEKRVDAVVCGTNAGWKRESNMGRRNNQNFVQIPFDYLKLQLRYRAEALGIAFVEQEESYTSKASFLDGDFIPTYGKENGAKPTFSGRRRPTRYKGTYKKDGFRGLYVSKDGIVINSDLNGSANVLRKAFPHAFENGTTPDFSNVIVVRNPVEEFVIANRIEQRKNPRPALSKSKARRLKTKLVS